MPLGQAVAVAATTALVLCRLGGFMVISPFPGTWVPARARVAMTLTLALVLGPWISPDHPLALDLMLALHAMTEVVIGLLIGASFRLMLAAAEVMAGMVSQAAWLSVPMSFNPASGEQTQVLAQVSALFALLVALGAGVHRVVIGYLVASLTAVPVGSDVSLAAAIGPFVDLVGGCLEVGMRLALPVFAISLAVQAALALIARVAPTLQIFNVGFAVLVVSGLVTFGASLRAVADGLVLYLGELPDFIDHVLLRLAG